MTAMPPWGKTEEISNAGGRMFTGSNARRGVVAASRGFFGRDGTTQTVCRSAGAMFPTACLHVDLTTS